MVLKAIDISDFQSDSVASATDADIVIVKATQGTGFTARTCDSKYQRAKKAGKLLGFYHYAGGGNAVAEANYFYSQAKNYFHEAVPILDWEPGQNASWGNGSWCYNFLKRIHDLTGVWGMLYTGSDGVKQNAALVPYAPLWFAGYPDLRDSWTAPNFIYNVSPFSVVSGWQFTDSKGRLDRSLFYLTKDQWKAIANPSGAKTVVKPAPKPATKPVVAKTTTAKDWKDDLGDTWYSEKGKFTLTQDINLRWGAKTNSALIATLKSGSTIEYDAFSHHNGYVWLRQPRGNGKYGYLASGNSNGSNRTSSWGKFSE